MIGVRRFETTLRSHLQWHFEPENKTFRLSRNIWHQSSSDMTPSARITEISNRNLWTLYFSFLVWNITYIL